MEESKAVEVVKRKYVQVSDGDFIKATKEAETVKDVMKITNLSYVAVLNKLRKFSSKGVTIKPCLLERQGKKKQ